MAGRGRQRPKRGHNPRNILEAGDTGIFAGALGGLKPGATESGTEAAKDYGVPQADLPGGVRHLVNPQTIPATPPGVPERPVDLHRIHGVEPIDLAVNYERPPDATEERRRRPAPEPKFADAVPVYVVSEPGDEKMIRRTLAYNIRVHASTSAEVTRICDRDPRRVKVKVLNEDSATDIRISHQEEELLTASAQGTGTAGAGALIWHGTNSYTDLEGCQDAMFALTTGAASALLSVLLVTEMPATGN